MAADVKKSIHLFRSMDRANAYLKSAADDGGAFGICATTPTNFVLDLAKMAGISMHIVDDTDRIACLLCAIESVEDKEVKEYFHYSGVVDFLFNFVKIAAGCSEFVDAMTAIEGKCGMFEELEEQAIILADNYYAMLSAFQMTELGTLCSKLPQHLKAKFGIFVHDDIDMIPALRRCIKHFAAGDTTPFESLDFKKSCEAKSVEIDSLTGPRGAMHALLEAIGGHVDQNILIASPHPRDVFEQLCPMLEDAEIDAFVHVSDKVILSETGVGQGLTNAFCIYDGRSSRKTHVSNLLHNPILDMSYFKSQKLEQKLREGDESVTKEVVSELIDASFNAESLIKTAAIEGSGITNALDCIRPVIEFEIKMPESRRSNELIAITGLSALYEELYNLGINHPIDPDIYKILEFKSSYCAGDPSSKTKITIAPVSSAKSFAEGSFDIVICTDTTTEAFSAKSRFDSLNTMFEKLHIDARFSTLKTSRQNFCGIIDASKKDVILMLPKRNEDAADAYPSAPLQEAALAISGMQFDEKNVSEVANKCGFSCKLFGEDGIYRSVGLNAKKASAFDTREVKPAPFALANITNFKDYMRTLGAEYGPLVLSPSAIEAYHQCPYKWFIERKISAEPLDAEIDQRTLGDLAHLALKNFYDALYKQGKYRLSQMLDVNFTEEDFALAFDNAQAEVLGIDRDEDVEKMPSILTTLEVVKLRDECQESLEAHVLIPKDYIVGMNEYEIKAEQQIEYGGAIIAGRVDRVDVNQQRNSFLVIDYKGGIKNHEAGFDNLSDEWKIPEKVQALIYASALERITGKNCDGALYLSYRRPKQDISDSFSGSISEEVYPEFSEIVKDKCIVRGPFFDYLYCIEDMLSEKIQSLAEGDIRPNPLSKNVCQWCNVKNCPKRWA